MKRFQLVKVDANTPFERGVQYGSQAKEKINAGIDKYKVHFKDRVGITWDEIKSRSAGHIPILEKLLPEQVEEAKGIAEGSRVAFEEIMALNCRYEILRFPNECTSLAVLPERMVGNEMILAQNWDYRPFTLDNTVIIHITYPDNTRILGIAEAGQLVRNGFNTHGIGICANSIKSIHDYKGVGVPVTFLRRKLLTCKSLEEALDLVESTPRTVSNNIMLAAADGSAVNLELTPNKIFRLYPKDGIIAHANHIVSDETIDASKGEKNRDKRLYDLLAKYDKKISIGYIKECFRDHEGYPESICSHNPEGNTDFNLMWQTNASVIYVLNENTAHICYGPPCEGEYVEYRL
jgi:isopenicillin-N N-acyltransferase-like protein